LQQSLIYIHPFPPIRLHFLLSPLQISNQKKSFLGRKKVLGGGGICAPLLQVMCMTQPNTIFLKLILILCSHRLIAAQKCFLRRGFPSKTLSSIHTCYLSVRSTRTENCHRCLIQRLHRPTTPWFPPARRQLIK
jgi:hypothetical protein